MNNRFPDRPLAYSSTAQLLHWSSAALMFAVLPFAWLAMAYEDKDKVSFEGWLDAHELTGLLILTLTVIRLVRKARDVAPHALPTGTLATALAKLTAWGLLSLMVLMPLSGYLWSTGHGHVVSPFHWFTLPSLWYGKRSIGDAAQWLHQTCRWVVYMLIVLHLTGVTYHVAWRRDGLLSRMIPRQATGYGALTVQSEPPATPWKDI